MQAASICFPRTSPQLGEMVCVPMGQNRGAERFPGAPASLRALSAGKQLLQVRGNLSQIHAGLVQTKQVCSPGSCIEFIVATVPVFLAPYEAEVPSDKPGPPSAVPAHCSCLYPKAASGLLSTSHPGPRLEGAGSRGSRVPGELRELLCVQSLQGHCPCDLSQVPALELCFELLESRSRELC